MSKRSRATLLHSVVWLQRLNGSGRPYPADLLATEIKPGERLLRWTCHDDDEFTFQLLEQARLTGIEEPYSYDGMLHTLTFERANLQEELEADNRLEIDDLSLVRAFAEQVITGVGEQSEKLAPRDDSWFVPWDRLIHAFDVLVAERYMERDGSRYRFRRELLTLLVAWGQLVEPDTDARNSRLMDIWRSMPARLKEDLTGQGVPDALSLAVVMGYFWDPDGGWANGSLASIDPNNLALQGGHIPTAVGIVDLLKADGTLLGSKEA